MRIHRPLLATAATVLIITSCGSSGDTSDPAPAVTAAGTESTGAPPPAGETPAAGTSAAVGIKGSRFDPLEIRISAGETVTFTNNDPFAHTVTSRDDSALQFDSDRIGSDGTFEVTFDDAGTYDYFCQIHPTMRAAVVVEA